MIQVSASSTRFCLSQSNCRQIAEKEKTKIQVISIPPSHGIVTVYEATLFVLSLSTSDSGCNFIGNGHSETGVRTESWTAKQLIQDFACTPLGSYILMIP